MMKYNWGIRLFLVLAGIIILFLPGRKVNAAEKNKEDLRVAFEAMNKMEVGQNKIVNNQWIIECREKKSCSPQKIHYGSKVKSKVFTVKRKKKQVNAFTIQQVVSFKINEGNETVSIQSYNTSGVSHLSDYSITKSAGDYFTTDYLPKISMGNALYDIYSDKDGTLSVAPLVKVKSDGTVKFKFNIV